MNNVSMVYEDSIKLVEKINTSKNISSEHYDKFLFQKYEKNENKKEKKIERKLFNLPNISPIKRHIRQSTYINLSKSRKFSFNEEKDEIQIRLDQNKKISEILNERIKKTEKVEKKNSLELNGLTLAFDKELPNYVKAKHIKKNDYLLQLNTGGVMREIVENVYMPGGLYMEKNRITSFQPKYIKKKFNKLKTEATEILQKNILK
jgi:hypothetical protein